MSIQNTKSREIPPAHPSEMLREDFMPDYSLKTTGLDQKLGVSRRTVNGLLLERRADSPSMPLGLSKLFGSTPEFWLNAQRAVDLWNAKRKNKQEIEKMKFPAARCGGSKRNRAEAAPTLALKNLNAIHPHSLKQAAWYSCEGE